MKTLDRLRQNRHTPLILLLVGAALLLLTGLGQRELWGAETRWAYLPEPAQPPITP